MEAVIFDVHIGIDELSFRNSIFIYPNPATGKLIIKNDDLRIASVDIKIFNSLGVTVLAAQSKLTNQKPGMSVDIQAMAKGMYWLEVTCPACGGDADKIFRSKFIKQ